MPVRNAPAPLRIAATRSARPPCRRSRRTVKTKGKKKWGRKIISPVARRWRVPNSRCRTRPPFVDRAERFHEKQRRRTVRWPHTAPCRTKDSRRQDFALQPRVMPLPSPTRAAPELASLMARSNYYFRLTPRSFADEGYYFFSRRSVPSLRISGCNVSASFAKSQGRNTSSLTESSATSIVPLADWPSALTRNCK
jgi:hypothetical protein